MQDSAVSRFKEWTSIKNPMKIKYYLIYVFVGVAFLAVSAWVYFSRGNNAKAIRAKYKLGGIMLMCLAMLSTASCGEILDPGFVTCYDTVVERRTDDIARVTIKSSDTSFKYNEITTGDLFEVDIQNPTFEKYVLRVVLNDKEGTNLQKTALAVTEDAVTPEGVHFTVPLSTDVTYKGEALVQVQGVVKDDPEELTQMCYYVQVIILR
jgi:hypothetical protein